MAQEIYHRSEWGNPNEQWGNVYLNADLTNELYKRASEYENSWVTDQLLNGVGTKPSIIMTPTAYEDGVLNSVKPAKTFGSELVTNGDFDTDTDWNKTGTWIISNGTATSTGNGSTQYIGQNPNINIGTSYKISYDVISNTLSADRLLMSGTSAFASTQIPSTIGHNSIILEANSVASSGYSIRFANSSNNFSGVITIDNVSVKEVIDGDFSFQRGSSATRVNEQGLVQDVQILSDELVQNGNFEEIGGEEVSNGDFEQIGSELVVNGDFSDNSWWGLDLVWSISNGSANCIGSGTIYKGGILTIGKTYKVQVEISSYTSGTLTYPNASYTLPSAVGSYTFYYIANSQTISFTGTSFTGSIDNVSVKEVGQDWTFGAGWSMGDGVASCDGSANFSDLTQNNTNIVIGRNYKITYTVSDYISGSFKLIMNNNTASGLERSADGTYTDYISALSQAYSFRTQGSGFIGSIDNVSVKEVGQNWTFGTGWSMGDGVATCDGTGGLTSQNIIDQNKTYLVSFDVVNYTSGDIRSVFSADAATYSENINSVGTYTRFVTSSTTSGKLQFFPNPSFNGSIDNVSVVEITDDTDLPRINYTNFDYQDVLGDELVTNGDFDTDSNWIKGTGWSISGGSANGNNTTTDLRQENVVENGKYYKVTYTISNYVSGSVRFEIPSNIGSGIERSANGTYTEILKSRGTAIQFDARTSFTGSIDNVSVKELTEDVLVPYSGEGSLLLEPSRTNLVEYSEDGTQWDTINATVSLTTDSTSPSGQSSVYKVNDDANDGQHRVDVRPSVTNGTQYTFSAFVKQESNSDVDFVYLIFTSNFSTTRFYFNIKEGTSLDSGGIIENYGNGWYKISGTATANSSGNGILGVNLSNADNNNTYSGTGNGSIFVWGLQLEEGYATSYIPTEGSIKTRLADVCNNSGSSDLINSTEGVLYAEISALADDSTNRHITLSDGSNNNRLVLKYDNQSNVIQAFNRVGGVETVFLSASVTDITLFSKCALKYKVNDYALWIDSVEVATDTNATTFPSSTLNDLKFGESGVSSNFYGNVKCVAVFKEALSDTELQKLTTI